MFAGLAAAVVGGAGIGVAVWVERNNQEPWIAVDSHSAAARSRVAPLQILGCKPVSAEPAVVAQGKEPESTPGNTGMAP